MMSYDKLSPSVQSMESMDLVAAKQEVDKSVSYEMLTYI